MHLANSMLPTNIIYFLFHLTNGIIFLGKYVGIERADKVIFKLYIATYLIFDHKQGT